MGNPQHTLRIGHLSRALHNWRIQPHRHESSLSYQCSLLIHYKMTKFDNLKIKFNIPCTISEAKGLTFNMPCTTVVHTHSHFYSHTNISIIMVYDYSYEQSIHISSCKFSVYFTRKNLFFLFYTITFTKHPHQFFYFTRHFNKIFTLLNFFIISLNHLSLYTLSLSFYPFFCFVALSLHPSL